MKNNKFEQGNHTKMPVEEGIDITRTEYEQACETLRTVRQEIQLFGDIVREFEEADSISIQNTETRCADEFPHDSTLRTVALELCDTLSESRQAYDIFLNQIDVSAAEESGELELMDRQIFFEIFDFYPEGVIYVEEIPTGIAIVFEDTRDLERAHSGTSLSNVAGFKMMYQGFDVIAVPLITGRYSDFVDIGNVVAHERGHAESMLLSDPQRRLDDAILEIQEEAYDSAELSMSHHIDAATRCAFVETTDELLAMLRGQDMSLEEMQYYLLKNTTKQGYTPEQFEKKTRISQKEFITCLTSLEADDTEKIPLDAVTKLVTEYFGNHLDAAVDEDQAGVAAQVFAQKIALRQGRAVRDACLDVARHIAVLADDGAVDRTTYESIMQQHFQAIFLYASASWADGVRANDPGLSEFIEIFSEEIFDTCTEVGTDKVIEVQEEIKTKARYYIERFRENMTSAPDALQDVLELYVNVVESITADYLKKVMSGSFSVDDLESTTTEHIKVFTAMTGQANYDFLTTHQHDLSVAVAHAGFAPQEKWRLIYEIQQQIRANRPEYKEQVASMIQAAEELRNHTSLAVHELVTGLLIESRKTYIEADAAGGGVIDSLVRRWWELADASRMTRYGAVLSQAS